MVDLWGFDEEKRLHLRLGVQLWSELQSTLPECSVVIENVEEYVSKAEKETFDKSNPAPSWFEAYVRSYVKVWLLLNELLLCSIVMTILLRGIRDWLEITADWSSMLRALGRLWRVETYLPFIYIKMYLLFQITPFFSNARSMQVSRSKKFLHFQ